MQVEHSDETKEGLVSRFPHLSKDAKQFNRAVDAVVSGNVKMHVFSPSGRTIYTVVGRSGDEFVDPFKQFCSCKNYFFGVLGGRNRTCYHLISYEVAKDTGRLDKVDFYDEEYEPFIELLLHDLVVRKDTDT